MTGNVRFHRQTTLLEGTHHCLSLSDTYCALVEALLIARPEGTLFKIFAKHVCPRKETTSLNSLHKRRANFSGRLLTLWRFQQIPRGRSLFLRHHARRAAIERMPVAPGDDGLQVRTSARQV